VADGVENLIILLPHLFRSPAEVEWEAQEHAHSFDVHTVGKPQDVLHTFPARSTLKTHHMAMTVPDVVRLEDVSVTYHRCLLDARAHTRWWL
jgi:hypothetical protein